MITPKGTKFTKQQLDAIFSEVRMKKGAPGYVTLAMGIVTLNGHYENAVQWKRTVQEPNLSFPQNMWLHEVITSGFYTVSTPGVVAYPEMQSMEGFSVRMYMTNEGSSQAVLNVIQCDGELPPQDPDAQSMVNFDGWMLLPVGKQLKFDKGQYPISSTLDLITFEMPQPWFMGTAVSGAQVGFGAQLCFGFE